jgi:TonB family protein
MTNLLDVVIRSSAALAVALAACRMLRGRSAALRHAILAGALAIAAAVGPLGSVLPVWRIQHALAVPSPAEANVAVALDPTDITVRDDPHTNPAGGEALPSWAWRSVATCWLVGVAVCFVRLLLSYQRLWRLVRRARPLDETRWTGAARAIAITAGIHRPVTLLESDARHVLATWGLVSPRILVPAHARDWPPDRIRAVLCHEMAHVARSDWLVQSVADLVAVAYWFNPLAWLVVRRLRAESERACDDSVLRHGISARDYAAHLVEVARACRVPSSMTAPLPVAGQTELQTRIEAMLNSPSVAKTLSRRAVALLLVSLAALAVSLSSIRVIAEEARSLAGTVYDPTGAVVPGVKLTLGAEGQPTREAVSSDTGRFDFGKVTPGKYELAVAQPGFVRLKQSLELRRDSDWERAVMLQLGEVQETIHVRSPRVRPQAAAVTPPRVRVGGKVGPPLKVRHVSPDYPASMRSAGIDGQVGIEAIIGRDGTVQSARVVSGLVHPDLAAAAIEAVRQWQFEPTTLNGTAVEVVMNVAITFELEE